MAVGLFALAISEIVQAIDDEFAIIILILRGDNCTMILTPTTPLLTRSNIGQYNTSIK